MGGDASHAAPGAAKSLVSVTALACLEAIPFKASSMMNCPERSGMRKIHHEEPAPNDEIGNDVEGPIQGHQTGSPGPFGAARRGLSFSPS